MDTDPLALVRKLHGQLRERRPIVDRAADYYDGAHRLGFASEKFREAFGGLFAEFADNWCGVVVDAAEERMGVQGFRVDPEIPDPDSTAAEVWRRNELDSQSSMGHADGLICGAFYVTVWNGDGDREEITVESPRLTIVQHHPKFHRRRTAALRTWCDDDGYEHAELFTPDYVYRFRSKSKRGGIESARMNWIVDPDAGNDVNESGAMVNPLKVVPVVEFLNRPRLTRSIRAGWGAHSEIARIMPIQDAVNKLVADLLVTSEFAAYPQRYLTGFEPEEISDPETGKPTGKFKDPKFTSGPGVVWWLEDTEAKFGSFPIADLKGLADAIELLVQHIASISATPPHYLRASADRLSGESIKSAESGLVKKVRRRTEQWGDRWAEVMQLAGKVSNQATLAQAVNMRTVWDDPETRTESEHVDAVSKKKDIGVPVPQLWEELGYGPEVRSRFPAMRAQDSIAAGASAAAAARLATVEAARTATGGLPTTGA